MSDTGSAQLSLDEAYEATFHWFDAFGEIPTEISEPTDGVIELRSDTLLTRIRWSPSPVSQGAVLAILRAAGAEDRRLVIFSTSGYSPGARSLAETQNVALYDLDAKGVASPVTSVARNLQPDVVPTPFDEEPEPRPVRLESLKPLDEALRDGGAPAPLESLEPLDSLQPLEPLDALSTLQPLDASTTTGEHPELVFIDDQPHDPEPTCPSCQHPNPPGSRFCARCGHALEADRHHDEAPAPSSDAGPPRLRCRTCGSEDIELIRPGE